ncbi:MAG: glutathione S-transferase family protein [Deltaproteobacteria bacterium]|nr:MAG: glutathione S-transferase family protein [Deltaproteobacteria bacterium]TMB24233.1 MAG: glutathione S-transferase family protein [Deltaproteobacteria bacterium]
MTPELHQFRFSHFNEKARWALDFKGVPHVRRSYLPGPHMLPITRLSGQRQVPVLRVGREIVVGSDRIIDYLETRHPAPRLYPPSEGAHRRALELQQWFDAEIGPTIRRAFFFDFLVDGDYAARAFTQGQGMALATIYRALFPVTRVIMRRDMQIDADGAARGRDRAREALDLIARTAGTDGYLVGEQFSVADLTAAALLSPTVFPPECPAGVPEPRAPGLRTWLARWADHPAVAWINRIYARHRGRSVERAA